MKENKQMQSITKSSIFFFSVKYGIILKNGFCIIKYVKKLLFFLFLSICLFKFPCIKGIFYGEF